MATWRVALRGYLVPVIKAMLEGFPFTISGFHADNGSEYTNDQVAGRLEKLRIDLDPRVKKKVQYKVVRWRHERFGVSFRVNKRASGKGRWKEMPPMLKIVKNERGRDVHAGPARAGRREEDAHERAGGW